MKNKGYLDKIINADCRLHLDKLDKDSIDLFLSDIPYGISLDEWDILHNNTNSALLGTSPAQLGKSGFKKRGKPLNGWSQADRNIGKEYYEWCLSWTQKLFPIMKKGSSVFIFGARRTIHRAILAMEDSGFILKDVLAWKKNNAHHRAQRLSIVFERRGQKENAKEWEGWRVGNLAPIYEPIAWFFKPYGIGLTITDNVLKYGVGAMNVKRAKEISNNQTNILDFWFGRREKRSHEAQKPLSITKFLIELTTQKRQIVLDPFIGSGTTAIAAKELGRRFIGFEINNKFHKIAEERLMQLKKQPQQQSLGWSSDNVFQPTLIYAGGKDHSH